MPTERLATLTASAGAALLFASAALHFNALGFIAAQATPEIRPLLSALWIACGTSLMIAGLLTVAVTPLFVVRRRALLAVAALVPLSIAVLQVVYLGFMSPTALLLLDTALLLVAGQLGRARQPVPAVAT